MKAGEQSSDEKIFRADRLLWAFFALAFGMAVPILLISAWADAYLLPGLPAAALIAFCPASAALVLVWVDQGRAGPIKLLRRACDFYRITNKVWYVPILSLYPAITVLSYAAILLTGVRVPALHIDLVRILALAVAFFVAALGEEIGWSGYATERLQRRHGALFSALILGAIWALYHFAALRLAHRSWPWIGWWSVNTMAARVMMVWIFNNTNKSVLGAALFHMTLNVSWQTFPVSGSYFDFRVTGIMAACVSSFIVLRSIKSDWLGGEREQYRRSRSSESSS